jgi:WD40 repeat protein
LLRLSSGNRTLAPIKAFKLSTGVVDALAISPDGRTLAGGTDQDNDKDNVRLFDVTVPQSPTAIGQPFVSQTHTISTLTFSPDGRTLASGSNDASTQLIDIDIDAAAARICAATRNVLTPAVWQQYLPDQPYEAPCAHLKERGLLTP